MSLRDYAVKGAIWNSVGTIGAGLLNFVLTMILARILTPTHFGLLELLVIFTVISDTFVDSGFSQAVIRDNNATNTDLSSVFFFNLIVALVIYSILFISSPLIANFYNESQLIWLSRFVFLAIIFKSLSIIQNANFSRQLNFKPMAFASLIAMAISAVVSVAMAFNGYGVWALALNMVLFAFLKMILLWIQSNWRPNFVISVKSIKKYFKFGSNLLLLGMVDKIVTNLESLIIGRIYTKSDLGYFSQARKLDSYIVLTSTSVIQRVTYPIFAKIGDDKVRLKEGYRRVIGVTMFGMIPMMFFVFASSENMIVAIFGIQWLEGAPYLRLWSIIGLIVALYSIFVNIFLVSGESGKLLKLSLLRQSFRVLTIILLVKISIITLLHGIVVVTLFTGLVYIYAGGKLIDYRLKEVFEDLWEISVAALVSAGTVYVLGFLFAGFNIFFAFALQFLIMAFLYWLCIAILKNKAYMEVKQILGFLYRKTITKSD